MRRKPSGGVLRCARRGGRFAGPANGRHAAGGGLDGGYIGRMTPPDYCFAWGHLWLPNWLTLCMPRSDWAAWAQAVGAIVGIGIAVWLPWKAERDRRHQAHLAALLFAHRLYMSTAAMKSALERQLPIDERQRCAAVIRDVAQSGTSLAIADLPARDQGRISKARKTAAEATWAADWVTARDLISAHWVSQFDEMTNTVGKVLLDLGEDLPKDG